MTSLAIEFASVGQLDLETIRICNGQNGDANQYCDGCVQRQIGVLVHGLDVYLRGCQCAG